MARAVDKRQAQLESVLGSVLDSGTRALQDLVGQEVTSRLGEAETIHPIELLGKLEGQHAVVCGALDRECGGQTLRMVIPAREAATLSGYAMLSPKETIEARRGTGVLSGEELETFAEVANVLCSGIDGALRQIVGDGVGLRAQDAGVVEAGVGGGELLGEVAPLVGCTFALSVGGHPEARGWLLLEPSTAERFGDAPVTAGPPRGRLSTYLAERPVLDLLRRSCRLARLQIDQRPRGEVPNPAEHRDDLVLMDVPPGDVRRFEWCKRLKQHNPTVKVALLIHHPSRSQVLKAFLAKADVIVGWPVDEAELAAKLEALLPPR